MMSTAGGEVPEPERLIWRVTMGRVGTDVAVDEIDRGFTALTSLGLVMTRMGIRLLLLLL